jgi:hypothetical protein
MATAALRHCPDCGLGRFADEDWCGCGIARPESGRVSGAGPWPELTPPPAEPTRVLHLGADVVPSIASSTPPARPRDSASLASRRPRENSLLAKIDFTRRVSIGDSIPAAWIGRRSALALSAAIALVALSAYFVGRWDAVRAVATADPEPHTWSSSR